MSFRSSLSIALKALRRHTLQTALTMLGMTIGVAAVLTMIALGAGAEAAIEQQVRAAGMNLIVVTAGNYKPKRATAASSIIRRRTGVGSRFPSTGRGGKRLPTPVSAHRSSFDRLRTSD